MSKILIIEAERNIQDLLCHVLEGSGFQTVCTNHGRSALEIVQHDHPDLIICDIHMSEIDRYVVLGALRRDLETATIPIIFLTVDPDVIRQFQHQQVGVDDCLSKPVNAAELMNSIQKQLTKRIAPAIQSTPPTNLRLLSFHAFKSHISGYPFSVQELPFTNASDPI